MQIFRHVRAASKNACLRAMRAHLLIKFDGLEGALEVEVEETRVDWTRKSSRKPIFDVEFQDVIAGPRT